jgi:uncharacterized membrane protein
LVLIHPAAVHFPIALLPMAFLLEAVGHFAKRDELRKAAIWLLVVGVMAAWLAVLTGYLAQEYASQTVRESRGLELLQLHSKMAYFVTALWSGLLLGRIYLERPETERWRTLWLAFAFLGCLLIFFTAYLGGRMVYEFGAGVARPSLSPIDLQGSMPR